jgi:hypothetical protein
VGGSLTAQASRILPFGDPAQKSKPKATILWQELFS